MDRRLWKHIRAARELLIGVSVGSIGIGFAIVLEAGLLATIVSDVYIHHATFGSVWPLSLALLGVISVRAALVGANETWALNHASRSQAALRQKFFDYLLTRGPLSSTREDSGALVTLAVQGIDDLEVFLARYFPQIVITAVVPTIIWIHIVMRDWISGLIIAGTVPLIPIFMVLIGRMAENQSRHQVAMLTRLNGHFLDVIHGLDTLKLFGRSQRQTQAIYDQSEAFRATTMRTLRIAFLSGMVLELIASLSMAFIAVAIGLRLIHADMTFEVGLMVLILAPEFYIPWRSLGAKFHDGLKGATAAQQIFEEMASWTPIVSSTNTTLAGDGPWPITWNHLTYCYPGRSVAALDGITAVAQPGQHIAVVGPSGSGKTTLIHLLLQLDRYEGAIEVGGQPLLDLDSGWWRRQMTWVTQHPYLFEGTILENVRRVRPQATLSEVKAALMEAGAMDFISEQPDGWDTLVGQEGFRLSGGQRQRIALARAFLLDTPYVIFDEPTQNLDIQSEEALLSAMRTLGRGRTTVTIAHRFVTVAEADQVWVMDHGRIAEMGSPRELLAKPEGLFRRLIEAYEGRGITHEGLLAHQVL